MLTGLSSWPRRHAPEATALTYGHSAQGFSYDPAGGFKALTRTEQATGWTSTLSTALTRTTTYQTEFLPIGDERLTVTAPSGLLTTSLIKPDGTTILTAPDGTIHGHLSSAYAGSHGCQPVEVCAVGVAEESTGTTAVKPWGSTVKLRSRSVFRGGRLPIVDGL